MLAHEHGSVTPYLLRDRLGLDSDEAREALAQLLVAEEIVPASGKEEKFVLREFAAAPPQSRKRKYLKAQ